MDIRFKLNEDTHKTLFNLRSGLKETLPVCDTCAVPPSGKFIVDMMVAFDSVITEALDTIWSVAPLLRIHRLELVELIDNADTENKPATLMLLSELPKGRWLVQIRLVQSVVIVEKKNLGWN